MNLNQLIMARKIYHRIYHFVKLCYHYVKAYEHMILYLDDHHFLHYTHRINFIKEQWYQNQPQIIEDFNVVMNILKPLEHEIRQIKHQLYNGTCELRKLKIQ